MAGRFRWMVAMAWVGLGGALSCRGHEAVCAGATCATPPSAAGDAGAAGDAQAEAGAGGTGDPELPACTRDADCDNGLSCDGREKCTAGSCQSGVSVVCTDGTTCTETDARCRYAQPSPWVLVFEPDRLLGLPVREIGQRSLLPLWENPEPQPWSAVGADWVPDGQAAVVVKYEGQLMFSYWTMRFGDGLPGKLRRLRDVPNAIFTLSGPVISFDSRYALSDDPVAGIFLSSLRDPEQPTHLLGTPADGLDSAAFCARSATWLESYADGTQLLAALDGGEIERRPIRSAWGAWPSIDGRLLISKKLATDEDYEDGGPHGVMLEPCAFDDWLLEFPEAVDGALSRDGSLLLLKLAAGGQKLLRVDDPRHPQELLITEDSELQCEATFSADTRRMLCLRDGAWISVAVDGSEPDAVLFDDYSASIPLASGVPLIGSAALLAWDNGPPKRLVLRSLITSGRSRAVVDADEASVDLYRSPLDPERVFVVVADDQGSKLYSVRLDSDESVPFPLLEVEGALSGVSPADDGLVLAIGNSAYFAPFLPTAKLGDLILLADGVNQVTVQPWP